MTEISYPEFCIGDAEDKVYGRIRLHLCDDMLRSVRVTWHVHKEHDLSFYLATATAMLEQYGGVQSTANAINTGLSTPLFSEYLLKSPRGSIVFESKSVWTPENGRIGVESSEDLSVLVDALCLITSRRYSSLVATEFAHYAAQVRPYAQTPSQHRTLSPVAMQR